MRSTTLGTAWFGIRFFLIVSRATTTMLRYRELASTAFVYKILFYAIPLLFLRPQSRARNFPPSASFCLESLPSYYPFRVGAPSTGSRRFFLTLSLEVASLCNDFFYLCDPSSRFISSLFRSVFVSIFFFPEPVDRSDPPSTRGRSFLKLVFFFLFFFFFSFVFLRFRPLSYLLAFIAVFPFFFFFVSVLPSRCSPFRILWPHFLFTRFHSFFLSRLFFSSFVTNFCTS